MFKIEGKEASELSPDEEEKYRVASNNLSACYNTAEREFPKHTSHSGIEDAEVAWIGIVDKFYLSDLQKRLFKTFVEGEAYKAKKKLEQKIPKHPFSNL